MLRVEVAEILPDGVQADDAKLTPEKRNTTMGPTILECVIPLIEPGITQPITDKYALLL